MSDGSDQELALRAARGDGAAFAALVDRHYDRIYRIGWRLTGSRSDAEDVAQDVCVKLAGAIRGFRGDSALGTWIFRITHNAATDLMRQRQRLRATDPADMMMLVETSMSAEPEERCEGDELWAAVRRLPGQQRDAVTLVYGEEMSHAEAAVVLKCSEKTVSWHLHEARKRLKSMLEPVS